MKDLVARGEGLVLTELADTLRLIVWTRSGKHALEEGEELVQQIKHDPWRRQAVDKEENDHVPCSCTVPSLT